MPARLTLYLPNRPARVHTLREGGDYVVGRDADCAVRVDDDRVSRRHAQLKVTAGSWRLADLRSKNGTQVDGAVARADGHPLQEVSWISFGGVLGRFEQLSEEAASRQQEEQLRRWHSSVEMQRRLTPSVGLGPLLERLLDSVLELSRTDRAFVLLADPRGSLVLTASRGMPAGSVAAEEFAGSVGAVELALQEGRAVATSDALLDPVLARRASIAERSIRALVCVPLVAAERLVGALYADSSRAGAELTDLDVDILEGLAAHAALAITVARLDAELAGVVAGLGVPAPSPAAADETLVTGTAHRLQTTASEQAASPAATAGQVESPPPILRADDTGLRWDELVFTHRGRGEAPR
ncbi:MAG TPA: FHA domain-containing protein [Thermoanaerobaculia bacterium]|jgi:hypothetical protein|nr:FHA domain-containing protein [Thermoanaerobaculia bacterium]